MKYIAAVVVRFAFLIMVVTAVFAMTVVEHGTKQHHVARER